MKTEFLNDWNILAIETAVRDAIKAGTLEPASGQALLKKLQAASHIRLSYRSKLQS